MIAGQQSAHTELMARAVVARCRSKFGSEFGLARGILQGFGEVELRTCAYGAVVSREICRQAIELDLGFLGMASL